MDYADLRTLTDRCGDDGRELTRRYAYHDPIDALPASGQRWWTKHAAAG